MNMKFLLELVSCCGSYPRTSSSKEETRSLVTPRRPHPVRGVKRWRSGRKGSSSVGEWRPSLSSISEEEVVAAAGSPSVRNLKRKVTSSSKARSRSCSYGEDAGRRTSIQEMMPAPFML